MSTILTANLPTYNSTDYAAIDAAIKHPVKSTNQATFAATFAATVRFSYQSSVFPTFFAAEQNTFYFAINSTIAHSDAMSFIPTVENPNVATL